jgi:hypothetical protein
MCIVAPVMADALDIFQSIGTLMNNNMHASKRTARVFERN